MRLKIILFLKKLLGATTWNYILKFKQHILFILHPIQYNKIKRNLKNILSSDTIIFIGTPQHGNVGDQAIVLASLFFFEKNGNNSVFEISAPDYYLCKRLLKLYCKTQTFCLHGGGNMGVDYFRNEQIRRDIITSFRKNKLVIFPQTIDYGTTDVGKRELENSIKIYNAHPNLTIFAREKYSFELMKKYYTNAKIYLVPDIVLSWTPTLSQAKRKGALFCLRHDKESLFSKQNRDHLFDKTKKLFPDAKISDTWAAQTVTSTSRLNYVLDKLKEFSESKLVITDRLHGMIFAAITKTPCIVFANYNHKVEYEYEWIKDCPYITFLKDSSLFDSVLMEFANITDIPSYSFESLNTHFQPLYETLKADN